MRRDGLWRSRQIDTTGVATVRGHSRGEEMAASAKTLAELLHPAKRLRPLSPSTKIQISKSSSARTPEQKKTTETNKALARSKRDLRICTDIIEKSRDSAEGMEHAKLEELLVEETWLEALEGELQKPYAKNLCRFVEREMRGSVPIYPPPHLIFDALHRTPFHQVKAVIIGQVSAGEAAEDEARVVEVAAIISGVEYCHRNMVVHRDLKPENVLLDSKWNVKIADFGLSNVMRDGHFLKTSCGSPNYAAPEVISGKLYAGPEVDVWSCGVILYALLCGTLPFDDENIPNLFKKIKGGIYTLPSHLSPLARDLIPRMLIVDPMKRITIREIREHPWFQTHLPRYLAVPPPDTMQQAKKIDEDILQEVIKMGFDKNQLVESLHSRIQNEATVSYYLLLDNRFRATSGYLGDDFQETMDGGFSRMGSSETPAIAHRFSVYMDQQGIGLRSHFPVERKWALGLQSRAHPREIMTEVLKALQELNVCWKKIGHYNLKCRFIPGISDNAESMLDNSLHANHSFSDDSAIVESDDVAGKESSTVKFEIQLYKTREDKYLLDLQRVSGPHLLFLDLCAALLAQLRVL
ncbi:unnamed protein product [Musa hybrid cultivar]